MRTGLDRLVADASRLEGRRYGLLCHQASLTLELEPAHLCLMRQGFEPERLFGPEHGFYGVEQDMVSAEDRRDPWTGLPIVSLYGEEESSLRPAPDCFADLDLLVIDLQDVGARYYTFAATAVWSTQVALEQGCEVLILDRPNPLGGEIVEGNLPEPGFESFVGAFRLPVRHGLTIAEIALLEMQRGRRDARGLSILGLEGWHRKQTWSSLDRPWIAPSPNMPSLTTVFLYPGLCLVEGTELSEGRGTTRPFQLVGQPRLDAVALVQRLEALEIPGVSFVPVCFRPQFQKHSGSLCSGVEIVLTEPRQLSPFRLGVEVLRELRTLNDDFRWRSAAYEFVVDIPAIDLLAGSPVLRDGLDRGADLSDWIEGWAEDERSFAEERDPILLYR